MLALALGGASLGCQLASGVSALRTDSATTTGTGGAGGLLVVEYAAEIATCLRPFSNPVQCEGLAGNNRMLVELESPGTPSATAFLRFAIDGAHSDRGVAAVALHLAAADDLDAGGPSSGEVFEVTPFTAQSLWSQAPSQVGAALAGDAGPVDPNASVSWELPATLVAPNTNVSLGVFALSTDKLRYWSAQGAEPPRLVVAYQ